MSEKKSIVETTLENLKRLLEFDGIVFEENEDSTLTIPLGNSKFVDVSMWQHTKNPFAEEKICIVMNTYSKESVFKRTYYENKRFGTLMGVYVAIKKIVNKEAYKKAGDVNHPSHYTTGQFETIDEMRIVFGDEEVKSFCRLNAWKYKSRAMFKGNPEEDLKKADWYLEKLKELEKKK